MTDLGIWHNKLDNVYEFEQFYLLFRTWCLVLFPVYVIRVLTSLGAMRFIHLFIDVSISLS